MEPCTELLHPLRSDSARTRSRSRSLLLLLSVLPGPLTWVPYATDGGRLAPLGIDVVICGPGALG